ncbi:hypothetical protein PSAB_05915 [Paenibacillus sabinae T27]|uniref:Uncharacterized protein n=1 Tax=Paenibacillus sabinae T27 TaxID=1268072 RepID=X4ZWM8_9BACL|nr:hypothetical protein PSAB_05915 [Paenibacillus sabinae T27]
MDKYENHLDEWREESARERYEREQARKPKYDPRDPRYIAPEGYCPTCEDHTTQIDAQGCCRKCGTEVVNK